MERRGEKLRRMVEGKGGWWKEVREESGGKRRVVERC